jgi:hypothetical protein
MMSGYTWGKFGSFGSKQVLPSARHTLVETSPIATGVIPKTNNNMISFLIIYPPVKKILLSAWAA